jgi:CheY-like chemotaxis protein
MLHSAYIVDDDHINNVICEKVIIDLYPEAEVHTFLSGKQALRQLEQTPRMPDLIFLDINMPELDGWQFLDAMQKMHITNFPKIIMLTSSIAAQDRKKAEAHSFAYGLIAKPLTRDRFLELMQRIAPNS